MKPVSSSKIVIVQIVSMITPPKVPTALNLENDIATAFLKLFMGQQQQQYKKPFRKPRPPQNQNANTPAP